jgi:hypothetical protein
VPDFSGSLIDHLNLPVTDPDGTNVEAVCHGAPSSG